MNNEITPAQEAAPVLAPAQSVHEIQSTLAIEVKEFEFSQRKALALSKSKIIPVAFQNNVADCMIAINMAERTGLDALFVLQNLYIVHGKPTFASQLIIAVINGAGRFECLNYHVEGEGESLSCVAYTTRKGCDKVLKGPKVTYAMAVAEGWAGKRGSKWLTMPELMIQYRAATFFGRLHCPDLLMGMQSQEELEDIKKERRRAASIEMPVARIEVK